MVQYYIKIQYGFMIEHYIEKMNNFKVTQDVDKALKFNSKKEAQDFINFYHSAGINHKTAKVIKIISATT